MALETSHWYCSLVEGSETREMSGWLCWRERGGFNNSGVCLHTEDAGGDRCSRVGRLGIQDTVRRIVAIDAR